MSVPRLRLANADFVTERLAVGGDLPLDNDLALAHVADLTGAGITHILDVRFEADDTRLYALVPGVDYRWDGIDDAGQDVPGWWFERVVGWALEALEDPDARVLAHCHMGVNRGPSVGFAILLALGWDPVEAIDAIRRARPIAHVWYADDALRWHHERTGADPARRRADHRRLAQWREEHPIDVAHVIAEQRRGGL